MSFLDRIVRPRLTKEIADLTAKVNAIIHYQAGESTRQDNSKLWTDSVHPHQPLSIYYQKTGFNNLEHRDFQSKHNPTLKKLSYGVANFLLKKTPYPFMYVEIDIENDGTTEKTESNEINDSTETLDVRELPKSNFSKSNTFPPSNTPKNEDSMQRSLSNEDMGASPGFEGIFGKKPSPIKRRYKLRRDLMDKYHTLWLERDAKNINMFSHFKSALSRGLAIKTAIIARTFDGAFPTYWVFGADRIVKLKGRKRAITSVEIKWHQWHIYEDIGETRTQIEGNQTFIVGKDCALITPFPCEEDPLGSSFLQSVWDLGIYQQQNRWISSMFLWEGGIINRIYRIPDDAETSVKTNIEDHAKAPFVHPSITIPYPPGLDPNNVDKFFQFEYQTANEPAWDIHNTINNQDSPFPKIYLEGQAETGALGGSAPEVDKQKEEDIMMQFFDMIGPQVFHINETFFGAKPEEFKDVIIVPWLDDLLDVESNDQSAMARLPDKKETAPTSEDKPISVDIRALKKRTNGYVAKVNSIQPTHRTYVGNLFSEGYLPQDDGSQEWLSGETIRQFVEDPHTVKEGYVTWEHPNKPEEIKAVESWGRYVVKGYDPKTKRDITEFYIYESNAPDEIYTSPMYYSRDVKRSNGEIEQTAIDLRNAVFTMSPRSGGTTIAKAI